MYWNYRLYQPHDSEEFYIIEQYYDDDNSPMGHTEPIPVITDSPAQLHEVLNMMHQAAERPVIYGVAPEVPLGPKTAMVTEAAKMCGLNVIQFPTTPRTHDEYDVKKAVAKIIWDLKLGDDDE